VTKHTDLVEEARALPPASEPPPPRLWPVATVMATGVFATALVQQRVFMKGVGTARPQFRPAGVQESGDEAVPTPAIRLHAYALLVPLQCEMSLEMVRQM